MKIAELLCEKVVTFKNNAPQHERSPHRDLNPQDLESLRDQPKKSADRQAASAALKKSRSHNRSSPYKADYDRRGVSSGTVSTGSGGQYFSVDTKERPRFSPAGIRKWKDETEDNFQHTKFMRETFGLVKKYANSIDQGTKNNADLQKLLDHFNDRLKTLSDKRDVLVLKQQIADVKKAKTKQDVLKLIMIDPRP